MPNVGPNVTIVLKLVAAQPATSTRNGANDRVTLENVPRSPRLRPFRELGFGAEFEDQVELERAVLRLHLGLDLVGVLAARHRGIEGFAILPV